MEGVHVGFGRRICTDASSKPLPIATRIVCGLFIALAQIRRSKLRCTCHGAIFERVLVRRTQEYKSIPRTTSRKSPEIAHVRRHGSLSCMPLFSLRATLSFSRYVFAGRKRIIIKKSIVAAGNGVIVQGGYNPCFCVRPLFYVRKFRPNR